MRLLVLLLGACMFTPRVVESKEPEAQHAQTAPVPTHEEVTGAVAALSDPELAGWVESPTSYVLRPADIAVLRHHAAWYVIPIQISRPMGFYVVRGPDGAVRVSSEQPKAVYTILRAEPELAISADLPKAVFELLRPQARSLTFLDGSVQTTPEGWSLTLHVANQDQARETWEVTLAAGASGWTVR